MTAPITVLMSVFNGERWLRESIESVLGQTYTDFEFIVVNDGSTDASLDIIEGFATADRRIRVIDKPNTGLADSLNVGIGLSRGEWIARIDADDVCDARRLAVQYSVACSRKDLVLIGTGLITIDGLGQHKRRFHYPHGHQQLIQQLVKRRRFFAHSSAFFRTQTVKALGGYRPRLRRSQDFDLWLRLSEVGQMNCVDEPLVYIRHHADQISHDDGGRRQIVDSRVALVSYFLRQSGLIDPVAVECTESEFSVFWQFVERGVAHDKLVEFRHFVGELKAKRDLDSFKGVCAVLALSARSPHLVIRYFLEFFVGETLAKRLADEWICRGSTCVE